jgi:hypothetical protein
MEQGSATAAGLGLPNLPMAKIPGHVDLQSEAELEKNITTVTLDMVIGNLTIEIEEAKAAAPEPRPKDIIYKGTFEEVNDLFYKNEWSDGLPIVPPTIEKVQEFLKYTDRSSEDVIGVLLPANRKATVWNIAVNGVMAGCRPAYMPILIAAIEAMADPKYGVEHSGNTPGADTLIILNGPIIKELGFNYEQGALRDGFQPNTSIGRFWRLYLRNVAGFLPHKTDKATYGNTWRVVLAENEEAVARIGWEPMSVDMGFKAGENVVTVSRYTGGDVISSVIGDTIDKILSYIADAVVKQIGWELVFTVGIAACTQRPHLILSPVIAETISKCGYSKKDVKKYLYGHARLPAWKFEQYIRHAVPGGRTLCDLVKEGNAPKQFGESTDPNRLVPIVCSPDDFLITISGDPLRSNAYIFVHNGMLGYPTSKKIKLPVNWDKLLKEAKEK